ncbi:ankyrin repeat protein, partial [Colletotrichum incanum]
LLFRATTGCLRIGQKDAGDLGQVTMGSEAHRGSPIKNVQFLEAIKTPVNSQVLKDTKESVDTLCQAQDMEERDKILDWLTLTEYGTQQSDAYSRRQEGTGQWFLDMDKFKNWTAEKGRTLLCPGMPGAGKTIMASLVVEELFTRFCNDPNVGIAYIYYNFDDQDRQTTHDCLSSLAKQLVRPQATIPKTLKCIYERHEKGKTTRCLQETLEVLRAAVSLYTRLFLIIDALDECNPISLPVFLREVFQLQQHHSAGVFATSRNIPRIIESPEFEFSPVSEVRAIDSDLWQYVDGRIPGMQAFVQDRPDLQELVRKGIINDSKGMFLLAQLTIDSLFTKTTPKALRQSIDRVTTGYGAYSSIYDEAMQRIRVQPPDHWRLAEQIPGWLTNVKRPLKLVELQHALALEEDAEETDIDNIPSAEIMISVCAGLVTINEGSDIIRLVHQTTQEYFDERKHILFQDFSSEMTTKCVGYLSFDFCRQYRRHDLWILWSWILTTQDLAFRDSCLPFYEYAALNWGRHARDSGKVPCGVVDFIRGKGLSETYLQIFKELIWGRPFYLYDTPQKSSHLATYFGILQLFEKQTLLEDEIYATDANGRTALWWAAHQGHEDVVKYLLNSGAIESTSYLTRSRSLGGISPSGFSPRSLRSALHEALARGHFTVFQIFIDFCSKNGLDIEVEGDAERSIFYEYTRANDLSKIKLIIKVTAKLRSAPIFLLGTEISDNSESNGANTARTTAPPYFIQNGLNDAIEYSSNDFEETRDMFYSELIQIFLDHGAKFIASDSLRDPASSPAILYGLRKTVKVLLNHGVDVETRTEKGPTLLMLASYYGNAHNVELLLQYKANIEADDELGRTALRFAIKGRYLSTVNLLLEHGAKTEAMDASGRTPLMIASEMGHLAAVNMLLEHGAKIEAAGTDGRTPLMIASKRGHLSTVNVLLEHGAKIDATDTGGRTPLTDASEGGHRLIVEMLLEHGAKIEATDTDGRTPLIGASEGGHLSTVKVLLEHGAKIEATDTDGRTPLIVAIASRRRNLKTMTVLLEHGAQVKTKDTSGRTALMIATEMEYLSAVNVLLDHGAEAEATDTAGRTALPWAIERKRDWYTQRLLDSGAKATTATEKTVKIPYCGGEAQPLESHRLFDGASNWSAKDFQQLLATGGLDPDSTDQNNQTPLQHAIDSKRGLTDRTEVILLLLGDPRVELRHFSAQEVFRKAVSQNARDLAHFLSARNDVDVNWRDGRGATMMEDAINERCLLKCNLLRDLGAKSREDMFTELEDCEQSQRRCRLDEGRFYFDV